MRLLGWILVPAGMAILGVEFLRGDGISLMGAGLGRRDGGAVHAEPLLHASGSSGGG